MRGEPLKIRVFHMKEVTVGNYFYLEADRLIIPDHVACQNPDIEQLTIQVLLPHHHDVRTNTIMDIIPLSAKVLGLMGTGITHTLTGVCVVLCGAIRDG